MRKLVILLIAAMCCSAMAKQRTTRNKLHAESVVERACATTTCADTISGDTVAKMIRVSGYEKPLRSRHETMLLTNADSVWSVSAVSLEITYFDMQGRTLHKRTATADVSLPPGATRLIDLKSWDVNTLFYYHLNTPTRTTTQGTPYRVSVVPTEIIGIR